MALKSDSRQVSAEGLQLLIRLLMVHLFQSNVYFVDPFGRKFSLFVVFALLTQAFSWCADQLEMPYRIITSKFEAELKSVNWQLKLFQASMQGSLVLERV